MSTVIANDKHVSGLILELDPKQAVESFSGSLENCDSLLSDIKPGMSLSEALKRLWNVDIEDMCNDAYLHGRTASYEIPVQCNTVQHWYLITASPRVSNQIINGVSLNVRDNTLVKRNERQLLLHDKMGNIALLASQVAHKLNNPLAAVLNHVGSLLVTDLSDENLFRVKSKLELMQEQIYSMSVITNALVAFSKESGVNFRSLDVNEIVQKSVELSHLLQIKSNITYHVTLLPNLPQVLGNEITLEQSFINIIRNALEAMPDGGEFTITTNLDPLSNDYICVSFQDTGYGIEKQYQDQVFDPFFKTKDENHSGLGLSISYGIIANHNGSIEFNSEPDKGTKVTVLLPVNRK